jgi:hypothetical protein
LTLEFLRLSVSVADKALANVFNAFAVQNVRLFPTAERSVGTENTKYLRKSKKRENVFVTTYMQFWDA